MPEVFLIVDIFVTKGNRKNTLGKEVVLLLTLPKILDHTRKHSII